MNRISICNIPVDAMSMQESLDLIEESIANKHYLHHVVVNAAKIVNAQKDPLLKASIVNCDLINADGQAVVWASKFLNRRLPERVAGIDLMGMLVERSSIKGYKIFLLGAKEEIVSRVVNKYTSIYGTDIIAGYRNGYFKAEDENEVANQIADSKADILFVAISSPKKEIFLNRYKYVIKTPFIMGVGGSFDVVSGLVKRAPIWMQNLGCEWLYRLWQEPRRMWKRYLVGNSQFIYLVLKERLKLIIK
jgi:N-acetylglucosaminyldiphosphoundecaprenol N-acetyl-beta-D-mannosaminyltransferase